MLRVVVEGEVVLGDVVVVFMVFRGLKVCMFEN